MTFSIGIETDILVISALIVATDLDDAKGLLQQFLDDIEDDLDVSGGEMTAEEMERGVVTLEIVYK